MLMPPSVWMLSVVLFFFPERKDYREKKENPTTSQKDVVSLSCPPTLPLLLKIRLLSQCWGCSILLGTFQLLLV